MLKIPKIDFGIKIVTYPTEYTKILLERTLNGIFEQTYKNWTVYLIGDNYGDELFDLVPAHPKIKVIDAKVESERFHFKLEDLEFCGGCNAFNFGLDLMENDGIKYHVSLDHDDIWRKDHLESLYKAYTLFPDAYFVYTRGNWIYGINPNIDCNMEYNNLPPVYRHVLHSSVSWRLDKIPLRYINTTEKGINIHGDGYMWQRMCEYFSTHQYKFLHIPKCTLDFTKKPYDFSKNQTLSPFHEKEIAP